MSKTVSRETVSLTGMRKRRRRGPGDDWSPVDEARLRLLRKRGLTRAELEGQFPGRTLSAIRNKLHRMGVVIQPHRAPAFLPDRRRRADREIPEDDAA
jgi:hypothetical protein